MNLTSLLTDNITEILIKIIEFTQARQKTLISNINNINNSDYVPMDLAVDEFSGLLANTIDHHSESQRLVFCDSNNIKFDAGFTFDAAPVIDKYAQKLLKHDTDEYLDHQVNKLMENTLNQRIAAELLRQKNEETSKFE